MSLCDGVRRLLIMERRLKSASPARQEAARLEVENAEDDLVQKTEIAITLMKTVLDNVRRPLLRLTPTDAWCYSRSH
jgi:hypothetical protein